tara:strand:- start:4208 stop:5380 length:1173 start_codon:yes stop_codon:yes gene_type:complete
MIMDELFEYCTSESQKETLVAYLESERNSDRAGKLLGINGRTVRATIARIRQRAAAAGWTDTFDSRRFVDPGQSIIGKSTLTKDDEGNIVWIKTAKEKKSIKLVEELTEFVNEIKPWKPISQPKSADSDLCTLYTITDYHIGMYSYRGETGEDWNVNIAEQVLETAIDEMVKASPKSEQAVFCQLGDLLHWDGLEAITARGKNLLDADGRYHRLTELAVKVCVNAVNRLLKKHKKVHVIMAEGNHDLTGSVWLRLMMQQVFGENKRVTVENSAFPYYYFVFGDVFLGFHHGHLSRIRDMPGKFYSEFTNEMGGSKFRSLHTGHTHQTEVIENSGCTVERHPTLSARDAHGARGFHRTVRAANAITYHRTTGEISRNVVYPRGYGDGTQVS